MIFIKCYLLNYAVRHVIIGDILLLFLLRIKKWFRGTIQSNNLTFL